MSDGASKWALKALLLVGTVVFMFVVGVETSFSQVGTSAILGYINDSSGAVIPGAEVKLTNPATGFERDIQSDAAGFFKFADLLPGTFNLDVTQQGFATYRAEGLVLQVDQQLEHSVTLQLGPTTQHITVTGGAPELLETSSGSTGQVITENTVTALPLNGRNFLQLATLGTGTTPQVLQGSEASYSYGMIGRPSITVEVGGNRETSTSYLLDGIEARNDRFGSLSFQLSIDEIQEFKVMRSFFPAEYGFSPGIVNVVSKAGSNGFHGAAWEFLRNNNLDSRNFFGSDVEPFHQNQFGATIGGPVLKNKLFFFGDYEGFRMHLAAANSALFPDTQQLAGDFSDLTVLGNAPIYDPSTYDPVTNTRQPFPGNNIPTSRISPVSLKAIQMLFPSVTAVPNPNNNLFGFPLTTQEDNQFTARLDGQSVHTFGKESQMFGRFSFVNSALNNGALYPLGEVERPEDARNIVWQMVTSISPATINEFRVGYQRDYSPYLNQGAGGSENFAQELGLLNLTTNPRDYYAPSLQINGFSSTGGIFNTANTTNRYIIADNLTRIVGGHSLKFGGEMRFYRLLEDTGSFASGLLTFSGQYTAQTTTDNTGAINVVSGTGSAIADMLLGLPNFGLGAFGSTLNHFKARQLAIFFQDDWKMRPGFTLQAGLRYEPQSVPVSIDQRVSLFDWATGTEKFPSLKETPPGVFSTPYKTFAPRLGFAWQPGFDKGSVLRGGVGTYFELTRRDDLQFLSFGPPYYDLQSFAPSVNDPTPQYVFGQNVFPSLPASVTVPSAGYVPPAGTMVSTPTPVIKTPTVYQWTLDYERNFGKNWLLEVGYAGLVGRHLGTIYDADQCGTHSSLFCDPSTRPFPDLSGIFTFTNSAISSANGLNVRVERRLSNGLSFLMAYRWMKSLDDDSQSGTSTDVTRTACRVCNYGPSDFDIRQHFSASPVWELPFGKGKPYLGGAGRLTDLAAGGWSLTAIATFQSGPVGNINPTNSTGDSGLNSHFGNCDLIGPGSIYAPGSLRSNGMLWLNPANYGNPPDNYFGNCGRNTFHGPGLNNWDLGLLKDLHLTETVRMEFRAEFFNAFNHAQFDMPNSTISGGFGYVTAAERPRVIQFALKLYY